MRVGRETVSTEMKIISTQHISSLLETLVRVSRKVVSECNLQNTRARGECVTSTTAGQLQHGDPIGDPVGGRAIPPTKTLPSPDPGQTPPGQLPPTGRMTSVFATQVKHPIPQLKCHMRSKATPRSYAPRSNGNASPSDNDSAMTFLSKTS